MRSYIAILFTLIFICMGDANAFPVNVDVRDAMAHTTATQIDAPADNRIVDSDGGELGGSAPCEIIFEATVGDDVVFAEWQISETPGFDYVIHREQDLTFDYIFTAEGVYYVRFVCSDESGDSEWVGNPYIVTIGTSVLKCPNAFSPGNADGVNDEWKVSYKSIISFDCVIFNRYGVEMARLSDPSQGWDGRYKGKLVPAGVYYYVIAAVGADGKRYELSGDINIINYK